MEGAQWLVFGIAQLFMFIGLFGLVVPIFPGTVIMWLTALGYGLVNGFGPPGIVIFIVMTVLMLASTVLDNLFMGAGAHKQGATWKTIALALAAGIVGTFIFPPIGGLIAAPLVVFLLEYRRHQDRERAWQTVRGLATGWGLSFLARFAVGVVMMILWWVWVWQG